MLNKFQTKFQLQHEVVVHTACMFVSYVFQVAIIVGAFFSCVIIHVIETPSRLFDRQSRYWGIQHAFPYRKISIVYKLKRIIATYLQGVCKFVGSYLIKAIASFARMFFLIIKYTMTRAAERLSPTKQWTKTFPAAWKKKNVHHIEDSFYQVTLLMT